MKRQTPLSAAAARRHTHKHTPTHTHTHTHTTIIFELAHLIKPLHVDLPLSLLQHQMFSLFSSHSSSSPPASPLMIFFIWRFPTDILIFQHHSLLHPPSSTHPLVSSLWFPFCTLQIWVRHPISCVGGGVEGGGGGGGVFFFVQITWPLYLISLLSKGSGSLQTAPFNFHHSSAGKPHKEGGTCKMSVSIRCSNWTQAAQTVPAVGWLRHAVLSLSLSLSLPPLTSTSWTFSSPAAPPLRPTVSSRPPPPRPLSCCRHTDRQKHPRHSIIPPLTLRTPATATTMFCLDVFCFLCKSRWDG